MCWDPEYILLITASTFVSYITALLMEKCSNKSKKKLCLIVSIVVNVGILFVFKYFNFFNDSLKSLFNYFNIFYDLPAFRLLLPVGISFYTFQVLSYSIDVYWGKTKPEKHYGIFSLYVAFFPQLVAGPIERSTKLLPQFFREHKFNFQQVKSGALLMLWGFFQKTVIADRLAIYVSEAFSRPAEYPGSVFYVALAFFLIQVFCDFSGYSDIAIGGARILGFDLMKNFRLPFFATSVVEFWNRWHMSLTTWLRDYIYFPLGGGRKGAVRTYINIMILMGLVGLWHGAAWTFVLWGLFHGVMMGLSRLSSKFWARFYKILRVPDGIAKVIGMFITFNIISFSGLLFRAGNLSESLIIMRKLFFNFNLSGLQIVGLNNYGFFIAICALLILFFVHLIQRKQSMGKFLSKLPRGVRWALYYALIFSIMIFGEFNLTPFVYFQF